MISLKKNRDSLIIVLHEIYGINQYMHKVCEHYSSLGFDVICPDLLNLNRSFDYSIEQEAYENFKKNVGFIQAADQVKKIIAELRTSYKHIFILGFSVGATTAWLCSDMSIKCDGIIGYYGSRIRDYLYIEPKHKTLLLFAEGEKSFNAEELFGILKKKTNVQVHILPGNHGFSDPFCTNYLSKSCSMAEELVNEFLCI